MKVPKNKTVYIKGKKYLAGEELPDDLAKRTKLVEEKSKTKSKSKPDGFSADVLK
jgi:hypothetical protein